MAAVACLSKDDDDKDRCNMTSDILLFLRMGFLWTNEPCFDKPELFLPVLLRDSLELCVCSGPYNHVTSQSLSQFRVSGETVLRLYLAFIHVRHDAFSKRGPLLYSPLFDTIYRHEAQISSSLQLCDR